jgi:hypothetical protein
MKPHPGTKVLRHSPTRFSMVLQSKSLKAAIIEANRQTPVINYTFKALHKKWLDAGCPGKKGAVALTLQPMKSGASLLQYFKSRDIGGVHGIALRDMDEYAIWRKKSIKRGDGGRTVDIDLTTLSNMLHYAVKLGWLDTNLIYRGRDQYRGEVRHAREVMPESAGVVEKIARKLIYGN